MYFNFDDAHPETPTIERAISTREGLLFSLVAHALVILLIIFGPQIPFVRQAMAEAEAARRRLAELQLQQQREREQAQFVFVQPRVDIEALRPPPRAELSDRDRVAQAPEVSTNPANPLPFARGNAADRVDADTEARRDNLEPAAEAAAARAGEEGEAEARGSSRPLTDRGTPVPAAPRTDVDGARRRGLAGAIGDALRNIERYVPESFNNPQGSVQDFGSTIQFDTKGVEFGPWIRRFVAQVKRNWFIPYAAMAMRGHVVITFYVHRDGSITDLTVLEPSNVESFTNAAYNALAASNPTQPLPPEYPVDRAFFTVTFYYNESPGGG